MKASVLIVEDERIVAKDMKHTLERMGYAVAATASAGAQAVKMAGELSPDLVLMDIILEGDMDGIEAAEEIRSRFRIPVVYVTAYSDEQSVARAKATEPYGYIVKPFTKETLATTIEMVLNKAEMEARLRESEERYEALIETMAEGVILQDRDLRILHYNSAAKRILGFDAPEVIGRAAQEIPWNCIHTDGSPYPVEEHPSTVTLETGKALSNRMMGIPREGSDTTWISVSTRPLFKNGAPDPYAVVISFSDISELHKTQKELKERDERLSLAVAGGEIGLWDINVVTGFTHVNEDWGKVFGLPSGDAPTRHAEWKSLVHPDDLPAVDRHFADHLEGNAPLFEIEHRMRSQSGKWLWVLSKGKVVEWDENHNPVKVAGVATNITERKRAEQALRESQQMLQTTLEASPVGISLAENRVILWVNEAYRKLFRFTSESDYVGKDARRLYASEEDYERVGRVYDELANGSTKSIDARWRRKDGSEFDGNLMVKLVDPTKPDGRIICALTDVSWRKRAESLLVQSERLKAIGELAGGVAHNFNNLLQIVLGSSQLAITELELGDVTGAKSYLSQITESAKFGTETVKRLQTFAKVRKEDDTRLRVFDLSETVEQAVEISTPVWKHLPERHGASIRVERKLTEGCFIKASESEFFELIVNLIKNAVEAMPDGGRLSITVNREENDIVLTVADTGEGIPRAEIGKVFEPFWTTKDFSGAGLGLSTAYGVVQRHGGSISVESEEGRGATFIIRMPACEKPESVEQPAAESTSQASLDILVVDDLPAVIHQLEAGLARFGHRVFGAESGPEAIEIFKETHINFVICDLGMPEMNGRQVCSTVQEICAERNVDKPPFLLLTGWGGQTAEDIRADETCIDGVVEKPVEVDHLVKIIYDVWIARSEKSS